jgi:hypothetical protein
VTKESGSSLRINKLSATENHVFFTPLKKKSFIDYDYEPRVTCFCFIAVTAKLALVTFVEVIKEINRHDPLEKIHSPPSQQYGSVFRSGGGGSLVLP